MQATLLEIAQEYNQKIKSQSLLAIETLRY
jgi:hypothetical protein